MPKITRNITFIFLVALSASLSTGAAHLFVWHVYTHHADTFIPLPNQPAPMTDQPTHSPTCQPATLPPSWHVLAALQTDLTHDGAPECTLLVWRPWQDWPIMQWSDTPSPIANNRDAHGDSAHIILIEYRISNIESRIPNPQYREIWAGSALALPILRIAVGDVDGDGWEELVVLEGDYVTGRYGPARHVAVWRWNGFGFTLVWRSSPGRFVALALVDLENDGVVEILVR
jgi:hypothetical protein